MDTNAVSLTKAKMHPVRCDLLPYMLENPEPLAATEVASRFIGKRRDDIPLAVYHLKKLTEWGVLEVERIEPRSKGNDKAYYALTDAGAAAVLRDVSSLESDSLLDGIAALINDHGSNPAKAMRGVASLVRSSGRAVAKVAA